MAQGERVAGRGEPVAEAERGVGIGAEGIVGAEERADIVPEQVVVRTGLWRRFGRIQARGRVPLRVPDRNQSGDDRLPPPCRLRAQVLYQNRHQHPCPRGGASPLFASARAHSARLTLDLGMDLD